MGFDLHHISGQESFAALLLSYTRLRHLGSNWLGDIKPAEAQIGVTISKSTTEHS